MWPRWPFSKKCTIDKEFIDNTQGFFLHSLENVLQSAPRLRLIHLMEHLCDEQTCSMVHNGLLMYRDHNHLSIYGSDCSGVSRIKKLEWGGPAVTSSGLASSDCADSLALTFSYPVAPSSSS